VATVQALREEATAFLSELKDKVDVLCDALLDAIGTAL
jgi:hypothetical protein